ncbi:hypothetical protein PG991_000905 [Apiospora marii]|uniref:MalT-like TPR region domain-containing protein n=1 Tax=Apiospora marii TaxID=335849 RepID=A0ABR1STB9_9PEZI
MRTDFMNKRKGRNFSAYNPAFYDFRTIHEVQTTNRLYAVILVDPFHYGPLNEKYGNDLEKLCKGFPQQANIYRFSFCPTATVDGYDNAIETLANALSQKLKEYIHQNGSAAGLCDERSSRPDDIRQRQLESSSTNSLPMVFLVHSLADWVVKSALAQNNGYHFRHTRVIIQIDLPLPRNETHAAAARLWLFLSHNPKAYPLPSTPRPLHLLRSGHFNRESEGQLMQALDRVESQYSSLRDLGAPRDSTTSQRGPGNITLVSKQLWNQPRDDNTTNHVSKRMFSKIQLIVSSRGQSHIHAGPAIDQMEIRKDRINDVFKEAVVDSIKPPLEPMPSVPARETCKELEADPKGSGAVSGSFIPSPSKQQSSTGPVPTEMPVSLKLDEKSMSKLPSTTSLEAHSADQDALGARIQTLLDYGNAFLESGESSSANEAFERCSRLIAASQSPAIDRYKLPVQMQLANTKMLRSNYKEALDDFETIQTTWRTSLIFYQKFDLQHWIATCYTNLGQHENAVKKFSELLSIETSENITRYSLITARQDFGFALACLGEDHAQAQYQLDRARSLLDGKAHPKTKDSDRSDGDSLYVIEDAPFGESDSMEFKLQAMNDMLNFTTAHVQLLWGNLEQALGYVEKARSGFRLRLGMRHPIALHCASLYALILAYTSRVNEARVVCFSTWETMENELGHYHAYTIEAFGYLAQIYQMQFRFRTSIYTSQEHVKALEVILGPGKPQTLRSKLLLAKLFIANGDYNSAEQESRNTLENARKLYHDTHTEILHYKSILALSLYHSGKLDQAHQLTMDILSSPEERFRAYNTACHPITKRYLCNEGVHGVGSKGLSQTRLDTVVEALDKRSDDEIIHPWLFTTLLVVALIRKQKAGGRGREDTKKVSNVLQTRVQSQMKGFPLLALRYETELASAGQPDDTQLFLEIIEPLELICSHQWDTWRTMNTCTASARRDLITAQCSLGKWKASGVHPWHHPGNDVESSTGNTHLDTPEKVTKHQAITHKLSQDILSTHERQLGRRHPETVKSLIWLFTLRLELGLEDGLAQILEIGLERLRHESVRTERMAEALRLEYSFATVILGLSRADDKLDLVLRALEILSDIRESIAQLPEVGGVSILLKRDLVDLQERAKVDRSRVPKIVEKHMQWLRKQVEAEESGGFHEAAEAAHGKQCRILRILYGSDDASTLKAQSKLAELKEQTAKSILV